MTRLRGAETVIVGIQPEVAFAMVQLGMSFEDVSTALARGEVAYGVLAGAASPFPWGQVARAAVELSPVAFLHVMPNAGHFVNRDAAPLAVEDVFEPLRDGCRF